MSKTSKVRRVLRRDAIFLEFVADTGGRPTPRQVIGFGVRHPFAARHAWNASRWYARASKIVGDESSEGGS